MMNKLLVFLLLCLPCSLCAQGYLLGQVFDFEHRKTPLQSVLVKNLTNGKFVYTLASGEFRLPADTGDLMEFSLNGYHTDTLYLINLAKKVVYLPVNTTKLEEVEIVGVKVNPGIFTQDKDIPEFKRFQTDGLRGKRNNDRAGGLKINLGYGKYRRQQDKEEALESREKYEREVKETFTEDFVSKLTQLKGKELKDFMDMYRPDAALVGAERPFDYTVYIAKAYSKWMKLSPSERRVPPMPKLQRNNK